MTKWRLRICLLIVFSVLFLNLQGGAIAKDCQDDGQSPPTPAGNAEYTCEWNCDSSINTPPLEFDDANTEDTIDAGGSITVNVTGGVPPYTFSTSSNGYTFDGGVQTLETYSTSVTLSCASGTCGTDYDVYATLTVTDCCGDPETIGIKNTSGEWVELEDWRTCATPLTGGMPICSNDSPGCLDNAPVEIIEGIYKWRSGGVLCMRDTFENAPLQYRSSESYCSDTEPLSYPEPPVDPWSWDFEYSCNPHYEWCTGIGCFVVSGTTYIWSCP